MTRPPDDSVDALLDPARRARPLAAIAGFAGMFGGMGSGFALLWAAGLAWEALTGQDQGWWGLGMTVVTGVLAVGLTWFVGLIWHGVRIGRDPLGALMGLRIWAAAGLVLLTLGGMVFSVVLGPELAVADAGYELDMSTNTFVPRESTPAEAWPDYLLASSCCAVWVPVPLLLLVGSLRVRDLRDEAEQGGMVEK